MLTIANADLRVLILDPNDPIDAQRQGSRYCHGGYIWQVEDATAGPLLAGPEWPNPSPSAFNGQGLPESFRSHAFGSNDGLTVRDGEGFILGVGDVVGGEVREMEIVAPCEWTVEARADSISFVTEQSGLGLGARVERTISLTGRTLVSSTKVQETASTFLPLHWFAHPFFALTDGLIEFTIPGDWRMAKNDGFSLNAANRLTQRRIFRDQFDGHFEELAIHPKTPLASTVSHPLLGSIAFDADFVPDRCPVWGNSNTWSIEPYIESELAPGDERAWSLSYDFGPAVLMG